MRVVPLCWLGLVLVAAEAPLPAQIGQYPGQYPPGYPGGGGIGFPVPHRNKKAKAKEPELRSVDGMLRRIDKDQVVLEADDGRIVNFKRVDSTKFMKDGDAVKPAELIAGDHFTVEFSQDDQGFMTAANVVWQQDGSAAERKHAAEPVETSIAKSPEDADRPHLRRAEAPADSAETPKPAAAPAAPAASPTSSPAASSPAPAAAASTAAPAAPADPNPADLNAPAKPDVAAVKIDSDDEGPPVLKRGKTSTHKQAAPPPAAAPQPTLTASNAGPPPAPASAAAKEEIQPGAQASVEQGKSEATQRPEDMVLEKAREAAGSFIDTLPNYVCQEFMTRYSSSSHIVSWQPLDVVSTALVYENGRESYRDVSINGKLTKKNIEELPGSWSTGEFGTVLADVFSPSTAADFRYRRESRAGGRPSLVYDFSVDREHSHWRIMVASQMVQPAYRGSVWIDKETKRVLRIEMQTTRMPEAFPSDKVESATDYEFVRFSDRQFLLPVHAETLSCERGTDNCSRNTIDFRNYHKYSGESTIIFK